MKDITIPLHSLKQELKIWSLLFVIVYIANINNLHKDTIIKAANYKKNILVEKPAFLNVNDFIECIKLIKKNNIISKFNLIIHLFLYFK